MGQIKRNTKLEALFVYVTCISNKTKEEYNWRNMFVEVEIGNTIKIIQKSRILVKSTSNARTRLKDAIKLHGEVHIRTSNKTWMDMEKDDGFEMVQFLKVKKHEENKEKITYWWSINNNINNKSIIICYTTNNSLSVLL